MLIQILIQFVYLISGRSKVKDVMCVVWLLSWFHMIFFDFQEVSHHHHKGCRLVFQNSLYTQSPTMFSKTFCESVHFLPSPTAMPHGFSQNFLNILIFLVGLVLGEGSRSCASSASWSSGYSHLPYLSCLFSGFPILRSWSTGILSILFTILSVGPRTVTLLH